MKRDNQPDRGIKKDHQTDGHTDTANWTCRAASRSYKIMVQELHIFVCRITQYHGST